MQIRYNGIRYNIRYANHSKAGLVRFASQSLYKALIDPETDNYKGEQEKLIGDGLYGFVGINIFKTYTDDEFDKYVSENFK